jgi:hypothetical protein
MDSQLTNLEAYIKNGQISIIKIDTDENKIDLDFLNYIKDHPNVGHSRPEYTRIIVGDNIMDREINRERRLKIDTNLPSPTGDNGGNLEETISSGKSISSMSSSAIEAYEKLVQAISEGKNIEVYVYSGENSPVPTKSYSGD